MYGSQPMKDEAKRPLAGIARIEHHGGVWERLDPAGVPLGFGGKLRLLFSIWRRVKTFEHRVKLLSALEKLLEREEELLIPLLRSLHRGLGPDVDDVERFQIAERLANAVLPEYRFADHGRVYLHDAEFLEFYRRFMDAANWHSYDRKYLLDQFLRQAVTADGDLAECGVYKGASAWLMCRRARSTNKTIFLFDSFQGLSRPSETDGTWWKEGALSAGEEFVRKNLEEFSNFRVLPGWIPARFPEVAERRFCFLHVDVDLHEPTLKSIEFFYPRMSPGGVMLFDDYGFGTCPGARAAIDEFFADKPEPVLDLPTGQGLVIRARS